GQVGAMRGAGRLRAQFVRVKVHGYETSGARAAYVVATCIANVQRLLRLHADRLQRVPKDLGSGFCDADDARVDDREHGHTEAFANLADATAAQLLLHAAIRVADDAKLHSRVRELAQAQHRATHLLAPYVEIGD